VNNMEKRKKETKRPLRDRIILWSVAALVIGMAMAGPLLLIVGTKTVGKITDVRKTGGGDNYHRYLWNISTDFTATNGKTYTVHSRTYGSAIKAKGYSVGATEKIAYIAAFPYLNTLQKTAKPGLKTVFLYFLGGFLIWFSGPEGTTFTIRLWPFGKTKRKKKKTSGSQFSGLLTPEQTLSWIKTYRRHTRIYVWSFFFGLLPIVFYLIYRDIGAITEDVVYSFIFFVAVFLFFAIRTRMISLQTWEGLIIEKQVKQRTTKERHGQNRRVFDYILHIKKRNKTSKLRVMKKFFDYFDEGDEVFKLSGFDYPERKEIKGKNRICIICGNLLPSEINTSCTACGGPVPDLATVKNIISGKIREV
jgi:hypothetical protein